MGIWIPTFPQFQACHLKIMKYDESNQVLAHINPLLSPNNNIPLTILNRNDSFSLFAYSGRVIGIP